MSQILTAAVNVTNQSVAVRDAIVRLLSRVACGLIALILGACKAGLDKGPASTDPVAVATVDQFVRPARKATLWRILSRG